MVGIVDKRVVDDRVFLLGLDQLYREAMKVHERAELLACARDLAAQLDVRPAQGPVEGYYAEDAELTEYFLLVRALQAVEGSPQASVANSPSYLRLRAVTSSKIFGTPTAMGGLLPVMADALFKALESQPPPKWTVSHLTQLANGFSLRDDEISLVGLAARAQDSVMLAALRESVVLYLPRAHGSAARPSEPEYVWDVDVGLERAATRFVTEFNELFDEDLPAPRADNAKPYWMAAQGNEILGRCVCVGFDDSTTPTRYYHWAVATGPDGRPAALERWASEVWTTERFRQHLGFPDSLSFPGRGRS